jgi:2,4-didehydro-3-deoxy-L-rhamnonate hydrolase
VAQLDARLPLDQQGGLVTYRIGRTIAGGVLCAGHVVPFERLGLRFDSRPASVRNICQSGREAVLEATSRGIELASANPELTLGLDSVELLAPVPDPDKIICLGLNYVEHVAEAGTTPPQVPTLFGKFRNALTGPFCDVPMPAVTSKLDYEGELAVVIASKCRNVPEEGALEVVAGYSVFDDLSARDLQLQTTQWMAGKMLDSFAPMGPALVPALTVGNPHEFRIRTSVNEEVVQDSRTEQMIFTIEQAIAFISSLVTLEPGDIITMGTPSGVGASRTPPRFLGPGDVVEVEISGLGRIRNRIVPQPPSVRSQRLRLAGRAD